MTGGSTLADTDGNTGIELREHQIKMKSISSQKLLETWLTSETTVILK
jgi:hypothetical protein